MKVGTGELVARRTWCNIVPTNNFFPLAQVSLSQFATLLGVLLTVLEAAHSQGQLSADKSLRIPTFWGQPSADLLPSVKSQAVC
jgi:hypothetical protein